MPITYRFDPDLVRVFFQGRQTQEETKNILTEAFDHPDFPLKANVLIDARESQEKRDGSELAALAALFGMRKQKVGPKCALIIGEQNRHQDDYERILSSFTDRYSVAFFVFFTEEDALEWLRRPVTPAP